MTGVGLRRLAATLAACLLSAVAACQPPRIELPVFAVGLKQGLEDWVSYDAYAERMAEAMGALAPALAPGSGSLHEGDYLETAIRADLDLPM